MDGWRRKPVEAGLQDKILLEGVTLDSQEIVSLEGFGDYFVSDDHGSPQLIKPEGLGVNIVAVVQRVEGDRVWIKAN